MQNTFGDSQVSRPDLNERLSSLLVCAVLAAGVVLSAVMALSGGRL